MPTPTPGRRGTRMPTARTSRTRTRTRTRSGRSAKKVVVKKEEEVKSEMIVEFSEVSQGP
jgi:hypothetical protein